MFEVIALILAALTVAASPNPYPTMSPAPTLSPPPFPPDGTYEYGFYRNSKRVGGTKVVIERRPVENRFDVLESGSYGNVAIRLHGGLAYADLLPRPWDVTYAGVPLPSAGHWNEKYGPVARYTVRYEMDQDGSFDVVDGIPAGDSWPLWSIRAGERRVLYYTIFEPPFMAGTMSVPATLALRGETEVFALSEAFPDLVQRAQVVNGPPGADTNERWPSDGTIRSADFTIWFDPKTMIVHQAWFKKRDLTVTLESQSPTIATAIPFGSP